MEPVPMARARLAGAAWIQRFDQILEALRDAGFDTCFAQRDTMRETAAGGDWLEHLHYEREFLREVLLTDDPTRIVLTDEANCRSPWLNARKLERFKTHGPVHALFRHPRSRHLAELSPCARDYYRRREDQRLEHEPGQPPVYAVHDARKSRELVRHMDPIVAVLAELPTVLDDAWLDDYVTRRLGHALSPLAGESCVAMLPEGARMGLMWPATASTCLIATPAARVRRRSRSRLPVSGTFGVELALIERDRLDDVQARDAGRLVIEEALPDAFRAYMHFIARSELALALLAWEKVLSLLVPRMLETLRPTLGANSDTR